VCNTRHATDLPVWTANDRPLRRFYCLSCDPATHAVLSSPGGRTTTRMPFRLAAQHCATQGRIHRQLDLAAAAVLLPALHGRRRGLQQLGPVARGRCKLAVGASRFPAPRPACGEHVANGPTLDRATTAIRPSVITSLCMYTLGCLLLPLHCAFGPAVGTRRGIDVVHAASR
jgi:hypothetical protein